MFDFNQLEGFEQRKKELFSSELGTLNDAPINLESLFRNGMSSWVSNAIKIRDDFPVQVAKFWAELFRSDFTLKFMIESQKIVKPKIESWTYKQKIDFIRDSFESIYTYFAFLTFCMDYSPQKINSLREDWYIPSKAKEFSRKKNNPWIVSNNVTSGKGWILNNCELFKFSPVNIKLINQIRNKESHYQTIVTDDKVIILNEGSTREISAEVDILTKFLSNCLYITFEFHMRLIVLENFWVYPSIILTIPQQFDYKKRNILFDIIKGISNNNKAEKESKTIKNKEQKEKENERLQTLILVLLEYLYKNMWETFREEEESINKLLNCVGRELDIINLNKAKSKSLIELLNIFYMFKQRIKKDIFKEDVLIEQITEENIEKFIYEEEEEDFILTLNRVLDLKNTGKKDEYMRVFIYGLIGASMVLFSPIAKLKESFSLLFKEKL